MSNEMIIFIFLLTMVVVSAEIIRRAFTETLQAYRQKEVQKQTRRLRKSVQPQVSVLIYGRNQAAETETTVRALLKSRYYNYDLVVVSDRSNDDTTQRVEKIMSGASGSRVQFLKRRKSDTKKSAFKAAYSRSKKGDVIICLSAGAVVDSAFIKRTVASQAGKMKWYGVVHHTHAEAGLLGLAERLRAAIAHDVIKVSAYNKRYFLHESAHFQALHAGRQIGLFMPLIFLTVLLLGVIFTANLIILWYGWIVFTFYLLASIWLQSKTPSKHRWALTFSAPSALFLLPATTIVEHFLQLTARKWSM